MDIEENETQPIRSLEKTMDIVPEILESREFAAEVARHHGWPEELDPVKVALLFLTGRFQWAIGLLTMRTETLKIGVDGNITRVVALEDAVFK